LFMACSGKQKDIQFFTAPSQAQATGQTRGVANADRTVYIHRAAGSP
jgi:hypothetical protein